MDGRLCRKWIFLGLIAIALITAAATADEFSQPATYSGVTFPHGDRSFADRIVSYSAASCAGGEHDAPLAALGPPDCREVGYHGYYNCDPCAVALGFRLSELDKRGWLTLEFVDNTLIDVEGEDLFIYITNNRSARVEISTDGINFLAVGEVTGYPGGIDIAPFVSPGDMFRFVRLWDVPSDEGRSPCAGPNIDAVGAMGPIEQVRETGDAAGALEIFPTGELAIRVEQPPDAILIILDSSSSMAEEFDGSIKIEVAKEILHEMVADLPDGIRVGLRIFDRCEYSRLLRPITLLDRAALQAQIAQITTGGPTPIAYALEQAKGDFARLSGRKLILLVSDGIETCEGDPVAAAKALIEAGYDLRIDVVGFDIRENPAARKQMMMIAAATGGVYYDAESREQLRAALRVSTVITYSVYDQAGTEVFTGIVGEPGPQNLAPGSYRVILHTLPAITLEVTIEAGRTMQIEVTRANGGYLTEIK